MATLYSNKQMWCIFSLHKSLLIKFMQGVYIKLLG